MRREGLKNVVCLMLQDSGELFGVFCCKVLSCVQLFLSPVKNLVKSMKSNVVF